MNNDYNLDGDDVRIKIDRIKEKLDAKIHNVPNYSDETEMLPIKNSSLFIPMNIEPGGGQLPGEIPVEISETDDIIDWSFENNINLAKDINVTNGSKVNLIAGTGGNGGEHIFIPLY